MSKVSRLHVVDLGPIQEAVLDDRAPVTILLGPNESGKSTMLDALHVLRFGQRGDIDVKDGGIMTRTGARGWKVEAVVEGEELKGTKSSRPLREVLDKALGDPRVFRNLTNVSGFLEMKPQQRKEMLADLSSTDTNALADLLESEGCPPEVHGAVRNGEMKKAFNMAQENRRAVDRILKDLKARAEAEVEAKTVMTKGGEMTVDKIPLEKVETGLQRLIAKRDESMRTIAARDRHASVIKEAEEAREELDSITAEGSWDKSDEAALLKCQKDLEDHRELSMHASGDIRKNTESRERLVNLMQSGGDCPTCARAVDGDAKAALKKVVFTLDQESARARETQTQAADEAKRLEGERAEMVKRREAARSASAIRQRLEARVAKAEGAEVPPEPDVSPDDLTSDIARLVTIRDARRDYQAMLELRDQAFGKIDATQKRRDLMARFEALVDPTRMDDESSVVTEFNRTAQECCKAMGVEARMDAEYGVTIQERPASLASDSLRIRTGFAFAVALSSLAGIGIAFLDRLESLDDANRKKALGMVKRAVDGGSLSWVLIAAVKMKPSRGADVPWLAWASVENGTVKYLEG